MCRQHRELTEVYPRLCGGTGGRRKVDGLGRGLSPPVRGNRARVSSTRTAMGSIPACAGEPPIARDNAAGARVYPRLCGGTPAPWQPRLQAPGLSPPVRGNRVSQAEFLRQARSIPACAGEPRGGVADDG